MLLFQEMENGAKRKIVENSRDSFLFSKKRKFGKGSQINAEAEEANLENQLPLSFVQLANLVLFAIFQINKHKLEYIL